jgi:hypothetical protein
MVYSFVAFPSIFNSPATTACRIAVIQGFLMKALKQDGKEE